LLILVVALFGARWYLDRQWYVGASDDHVAIFQGVPLTVLGYELGHPVKDFPELPAGEVRELGLYPTFDDGIAVADYEEAVEQVELMRTELENARAEARQDRANDENGGGG
jgi:hypothetical protein